MENSIKYLIAILIVITMSLVVNTSAKAEVKTTLTPYLWLSGIDGDVMVKGYESSVEAEFSDIVENLDFAMMLHIEMRDGKLAFFIDPIFLQIVQDATVGSVNARIENHMEIIELGLSYRFIEKSAGKANLGSFSVDVYGGGRYMFLGTEIDAENEVEGVSADVEDDVTWFDPMIGLSLNADLTRRIQFLLRGDIGGFDFGNASDFTWSLMSGFGVQLSKRTKLWAGYKVLDIDYDQGLEETNTFKYDIRTSGPVLGLGIRF